MREKYSCRILVMMVGNSPINVESKGIEYFGGDASGRWRNHPADSIVTYTADSERVSIEDKFSDGSSSKRIYSKEVLNSGHIT